MFGGIGLRLDSRCRHPWRVPQMEKTIHRFQDARIIAPGMGSTSPPPAQGYTW